MSNHLRRRFVVALSVLAMILGVVFIPTLFAQRVAPTPQDAPLRTITLSGKVDGLTNSSTDPQAGPQPGSRPRPLGSRPRPLSQAQRAILFKGKARAATKSFTLTPAQPTFSDKAKIFFVEPVAVIPEADGGAADFHGGSTPGTSPGLGFSFNGKAGQLYALDISVGNHPTYGAGTYTLSNSSVQGATQTIPYSGGDLHITAYVTPEQSGRLRYTLQCSKPWVSFSIEVTEL